MENYRSTIRRIFQILPIIGFSLFFILAIYAYRHGIFQSTDSLQVFIQQFGQYAVLIFILLQIIQVIIPILPGGISSVVGMLMFGTGWGLVYSYIGLVIGEALGFLLVRYYGVSFVQLILSPKKYQKFNQLLTAHTQNIRRFLIWTLILPFAPDDLVCLVAGLTKMSFREYMRIILILKPWSVGIYGLMMLYLFRKAQGL
ncbi:TVP38/TMEM64 family protein [Enterococcus thailandicus]|uniref:TVP38/TMEM64 family membrane protein n=1 Tax=Enterococcus thailandicus TaxID=417368 RepID=A0A510WER2_ENTTH|nr:VTT domain-containing protein [Enterococcus thailandicus]MDT2846348.1 VTT domain-containing protein [Enterococcus thailandicus]OJG95055.1 membrane protein [Enterococcus thailandicus]GEK37031.1 TVP38/TMEM64 family protein [Enterococcus thailandicus]GMC00605.1 TVP38/TMEM64 family protein [Enterococcus thailandicus]